MPIIEVVANVRVEQEIQGYEVTLELSTSANRKVACFDQAVALRETVIGLLKTSGLTDADICEGGGEAVQNSWSSSKSIVHRISIRHKSMEILMSAMAATERHFTSLPRRFFGGIKQVFTFHTPEPIYATNVSADAALRNAIQDARKVADVIAVESGYRLGKLISVVELYLERRPDSNASTRHAYPDDATLERCTYSLDADDSVSYTPLPQQAANVARRFYVRFAAEDTEQSDPPSHP